MQVEDYTSSLYYCALACHPHELLLVIQALQAYEADTRPTAVPHPWLDDVTDPDGPLEIPTTL